MVQCRYILPGAIYLRIHKGNGWRMWVSKVLLGCGCGIIPVALTFIIRNGGRGH
jgi:putative component of toxin-antitoxin plasmid stabilization module